MKNYILVLFGLFLLSDSCYSQSNLHRLYNFTNFGRSSNVVEIEGQFVLPLITIDDFIPKSEFYLVDENLELSKLNTLPSFIINSNGFHGYSNSFLSVGSKLTNEKKINYLIFNDQLDLIQNHVYEVTSDFVYSPNYDVSGDNIYMVTSIKDTLGELSYIELFKINANGDLIWRKQFGSNDQYTVQNDILATSDGGVLLVNQYRKKIAGTNVADPEQKDEILKISPAGELIWSYYPEYKVNVSPSRHSTIELENNDIILCRDISVFEDPDFEMHNWSLTPIRLTHLDQNGNFKRDTTYITPTNQRDNAGYLIHGIGDYFFIVGNYQDENLKRYGMIIKSDFDGNFIWKKYYYFNECDENHFGYSVDHILEDESGELLVQGIQIGILELTDKPWLMKLSEDGCPRDVNCGDVITFESRKNCDVKFECKIYPNPSNDSFYISMNLENTIKRMTLFSSTGSKVKVFSQFTSEFSIENNGLYLLVIELEVTCNQLF